jgi:hypothetical protein
MLRIIVQGVNLDDDQATNLEQEFKNENINLVLLEELNLGAVDAGIILITIQAMQAIGYNALYDMIKYSVLKLLRMSKSNSKKGTFISIRKEGEVSDLFFSFDLTEDQREKLVDAAITKLLEK